MDAYYYDSTDYRYFKFKNLHTRSHTTFILNGSNADPNVLKRIRQLVHTMVTQRDSTSLLKVEVAGTTKYQSVVDLFSLPAKYESPICLGDKNDFWISVGKFESPPRMMYCGNYLLNQSDVKKSKIDLWNDPRLWPTMFLLGVLLFINLLSLILRVSDGSIV